MRFPVLLLLVITLLPEVAAAQLFPSLPFDSRQFRIEQLSETHLRLIDEVEIDGGTYGFFADQVDIYVEVSDALMGPVQATRTDDVTFSLVATGNVVYTSKIKHVTKTFSLQI